MRENGFDVTFGGSSPTADSYTVRISETAAAGLSGTVYVTVSAAWAPEEEASNDPLNQDEQGLSDGVGDTIWLCTPTAGIDCSELSHFQRHPFVNGVEQNDPQRAVVLTFLDGSYTTEQTVYVLAYDDLRSEGDRVVVVQHSVIAPDDEQIDGLAVQNLEVTVRDNDTPGIYVTEVDPVTGEEDRRTVVIEGTDYIGGPTAAETRLDDVILVELANDPGDGETVVVDVFFADSDSEQALILFVLASTHPLYNPLAAVFDRSPARSPSPAVRTGTGTSRWRSASAPATTPDPKTRRSPSSGSAATRTRPTTTTSSRTCVPAPGCSTSRSSTTTRRVWSPSRVAPAPKSTGAASATRTRSA